MGGSPDQAAGFRYGRCEATMYQCSGCGHTSAFKHAVQTHLSTQCPSSRLLKRKCALFVRPVDQLVLAPDASVCAPVQTAGAVTTTGDHNTVSQTVNQIVVNVHPVAGTKVVYVGSEQERQKLFDLFRSPESLRELAGCDPEEIPAALFRLWKGADAPPELHNIKVVGNRVEQLRGPDNVVSVPRSKFVKHTVGDMFDTVAKVTPGMTSDPSAVDKMQEDLTRRELPLGRKHRVSKLEAVRLHACSSKQAYDLGVEGRAFVAESSQLLNKELDHYAVETAPPF